MTTIFDDEIIELQCECGRKIKKTFGWLHKNHKVSCPCGITVVVDTEQAFREFESTQKTLDSITKNITIKL